MRYLIIFFLFFTAIISTKDINAQISNCNIKDKKVVTTYKAVCIYTLLNGDEYIGEWKDGLKHGQGTSTVADGDKYIGEFKDGLFRHGKGTMTYLNGNEYVGGWVDGIRNGKGILTLPNGKKFVGYFNDGIFGNGIYKLGNLKDLWHGINYWYYQLKV